MVVSCQSVKFQSIKSPPSFKGHLSCTSNPPGGVLVGRSVELVVQAPEDYPGRVQQTIKAPSSSKSYVLKKEGPDSLVMVRSDGKNNHFQFNSIGDYTVNLRSLDYDAALEAKCRINVYSTCPRGTKRIGVNAAFVVDNSNSHVGSDCPERKRISGEGVDAVYSCGLNTYRALSASYASSILGEVGKAGGKATSHVAFVSFPQPTGESSAASAVWFHAGKERALFEEKLGILFTPRGTTPYWEGLQGVRDLIKEKKGERTVIFFVTDGFPTDRNPAFTLRLANKIRSAGVKILSVMVTGRSSQRRLRAEHTHYLQSNFPRDWATKHYESEESYLLELLGDGSEAHPGLLRAMSDEVVYIEESNQLQYAIHGLVATEALECQKS